MTLKKSLPSSPKVTQEYLDSLPELLLSLLVVLLAVLFGTVGYMVVEGWSAFDSFYMTVITLATIGYGETHPLTTEGRVFTVVLIILGVGAGTVVFSSISRIIIGGQIARIFERSHKVKEKIDALQGHTIFCGFSRLGRVAAEELQKSGSAVVIIESDPHRVEEAKDAGFLVIQGDATLDETLQHAGIARAARLVSLLPRDSDNLYVILTGREMSPGLYIVSRAEDEMGERRLQRAGVDRLISTYRLAARKLADGIMRPYITDFFEGAGSGADGWKIEEIRIPASSFVCGKTLGELAIRQRSNVSIAAVVNPAGVLELNPGGETVLDSGATLIAIGWKKDIKSLESFVFGTERL
jgi:voltage-gated potassium channel